MTLCHPELSVPFSEPCMDVLTGVFTHSLQWAYLGNYKRKLIILTLLQEEGQDTQILPPA